MNYYELKNGNLLGINLETGVQIEVDKETKIPIFILNDLKRKNFDYEKLRKEKLGY